MRRKNSLAIVSANVKYWRQGIFPLPPLFALLGPRGIPRSVVASYAPPALEALPRTAPTTENGQTAEPGQGSPNAQPPNIRKNPCPQNLNQFFAGRGL